MKQSSGKVLIHSLAAVTLSAASLLPYANAVTTDPVVQNAGSVSYVSGGVGLEALDRLDAMAGQYNLKLVFALNSGAYLSDVRVNIADAAGKPLVDTQSEGPWFLTKLPAGTYHIVASYAGSSEKRTVAVGPGRMRTVDFRWARE